MKKFLFLACLIAPLAIKAQDGFMRTPKGVMYKLVTKNPGERIKMDDVISFQVIQKTEKDSVLFSSYPLGHPIKLQVKPSTNIGDLMEIFPLMTVRDSAVVKVPTDSIFVGHEESRPPFLPKGGSIIFTVKIEKVQSLNDAIAERNAEMEKMKSTETTAADKYIADHKLTLKATPSGLKYSINNTSNGRKVMSGDTLLVNYTGRNLEDKVFDTSVEADAKAAGIYNPMRPYEPYKLVAGQGGVIQGWVEGLMLLNQGSKATLVIPSKLAYGEQGSGPDIRPFNTLVFEIEVVKVIRPAVKKVTAAKGTTTATAKKAPAASTVKKPVATPAKKPAAAPVKKK
jgi:FKBP-type peptidyl-prolyl cis-trans isomerase FkpA